MGNFWDARDDKEKKLSSMVFNSYLECDDKVHYNALLNEISNKYHKSINYLRCLKEVYLDVYASKDDIKKYKNKVDELKTKSHKFISFCDELFSLPAEKRNNYVISSNISCCDLYNYFEKYKRNNGKYSSQVDEFYKQYVDFFSQYKNDEIENNNLRNYQSSCFYFGNLVNLGFYDIRGYVEYLSSTRYDIKKGISNANSRRKYIKRFDDGESWIDYKLMMEENRKNNFLMIKDRVDLFLSKLSSNESMDIIDYYMIVGVRDDLFVGLCNGFVSNLNILQFKKFISFYKNSNLLSYCQFMYVDSSFSDKDTVIQFLYNNNIPFEYFNFALAKYYAGGLDQYIGRSKKIANL